MENILLISEDQELSIFLQGVFNKFSQQKYALEWVQDYAAGLGAASSGQFDGVLVDHAIGQGAGLRFIEQASEAQLSIPFILLRESGLDELDFEALEKGAADSIERALLTPARLEKALSYALAYHRGRHRWEAPMRKMVPRQQDGRQADLAENAIREAQKKAEWMARFPDENPNPVMRVTGAGKVLYTNKASTVVSGWRGAGGQGLADPLVRILSRAMSLGTEVLEDVQFGEKTYSISVMPNLNEGYANLYWREVTERVKMERALQQSEERFRIALDNIPIIVCTLDRDLRINWIYNARLITQEIVLGRRFDDFLNSFGNHQAESMLNSVIDQGQSQRGEIDLLVNGQKCHFLFNLEPLHDAQHAIIGLTASMLDITALRSLQAEKVQHLAHIEIQRRLIRQREMERLQIARNLHDGPFQTLNAANISLIDTIAMEEHSQHIERMQWVQLIFDQQIQEFREFIQELRPPALVSFGLEASIRSHLQHFKTLYPAIELSCDLMNDGKILPEETRLSLYRIYQEAMINAGRHASAGKIEVTLTVDDQQVTLQVFDNGIGFDVPEYWADLALSDHLGLISMRERSEMMDGSLEIQSQPGKGTLMRISVPLERN